jgi:hypothetical protein
MVELAKILRLVEEGALSPAEADRIIAALTTGERFDGAETAAPGGGHARANAEPATDARARHLRVHITEGGRQVVNLRIPINVASFAAGIVPGLPDSEAERVREAIRSGVRGSIVDITSEDGDRVLITTE